MTEIIKTLGFKVPMSVWHFLRKYAYENETSVSGAVKMIVEKEMEKENAETVK